LAPFVVAGMLNYRGMKIDLKVAQILRRREMLRRQQLKLTQSETTPHHQIPHIPNTQNPPNIPQNNPTNNQIPK